MNVEKRIRRIRDLLSERNLAGIIVSRYQTQGYLTGVYQRWKTIMFVPRDGKPIVCSIERERVQDEAWDCDLLEFTPTPFMSSLYYSKIETVVNEIKKVRLDGEKLGFEKAHMSISEFEQLKSLLPHAELINAEDLIPSIMLIKDNEELKVLRKLAAIADAGLNEALKTLRAGVTELEVSGLMDLTMKRLGAEKMWFPTHVASGYRSNFRMAYPSDKVIQYGDKVALDVGPMFQLYCGQLNTQVVVGKGSSEYKRLFDNSVTVLQGIFDSLEPGKKASDVYYSGERKAKETGYNEFFPLFFGRGIGIIENEELLTLSPYCQTMLKPGMVLALVTYLRYGEYVISNERMVEITEHGARWLSSFPLGFVEI